jgi:hypothetical protein
LYAHRETFHPGFSLDLEASLKCRHFDLPDHIIFHALQREDSFSCAPLTPEMGEVSFTRKTPAASESPAKPRFSQLAWPLLLQP